VIENFAAKNNFLNRAILAAQFFKSVYLKTISQERAKNKLGSITPFPSQILT